MVDQISEEIIKVTREYVDKYINQLPDIYSWKIPKVKDEYKEFQEIIEYCRNINSNLYHQNIELRNSFNNVWNSSHFRNDTTKLNLARWYVGEWGGIKEPVKNPLKRSNRIKKLQEYIIEVEDISKLLNRGKEGIASWSKILSFVNPNKYAIFDSRVSFSLLAIQMLYEVNKPINTILPSRNKIINEAIKLFKSKYIDWGKPDWKAFYMHYNNMLEKVRIMIDANSIQQVEMVLFAQAESLAKEIKEKIK